MTEVQGREISSIEWRYQSFPRDKKFDDTSDFNGFWIGIRRVGRVSTDLSETKDVTVVSVVLRTFSNTGVVDQEYPWEWGEEFGEAIYQAFKGFHFPPTPR